MTSSQHGPNEDFLTRLGQNGDAPLDEKRHHLKSLTNALKHGLVSVPSQSDMAVVHQLAEDGDWEVRQDVAELLLYVPEGDFSRLAGLLIGDSNGFVRRSAQRNRQRRQKAQTEAREASRGIDQVSRQYESLTRQVGGEIADRAINLGEARFAILTEALIHDLLNMLTAVKPQVKQLVTGLAEGPAGLLDVATKCSGDLDFMVRYIKAMAAYSQALPIDRHPEWIQEVLRQAVDQAQRGIQGQGLDTDPVVFDGEDVLEAQVPMCRELVVQAIANIVTNAYEALLDEEGEIEKGRIWVTSRVVEGSVAIEIHDNGCGMSEEELTALLAFLPGRKNRKKKQSTGLGLLTAKKNIEAHGGKLGVDSELGEGTTVTVTLPLTAEDALDGQSPDR